ncbi:UNVERIFIED_CONTAM: Chemotaxis protein histidine kinase and related kinases [Acetivibrio alkalicellulosi]
MDQLFSIFIEETKEQMESMLKFLETIEDSSDNKDVINSLFRIAHSMKGSSASMGYSKMAELTHNMENILQEIRDDKIKISKDITELLFVCRDFLKKSFDYIRDNGKEDVNLSSNLDKIILRLNCVLKDTHNNYKDIQPFAVDQDMNLYFMNEIKSQIMKIESEIMSIQNQRGSSECILDIFNDLHILRSYSGFINNQSIKTIASSSEKLIDRIIKTNGLVEKDTMDLLLYSCQLSREIIDERKKENCVEIIEQCNKIEEKVKTFKTEDTTRVEDKVIDQDIGKSMRIPFERLEKLMSALSDVFVLQSSLIEQADKRFMSGDKIKAYLLKYGKHVRNMQNLGTRLKKTSFKEITREAIKKTKSNAYKEGKEINITIEGEETLIDRSKIEKIRIVLNNTLEYIVLGLNSKKDKKNIDIKIIRNYETVQLELNYDYLENDPIKTKTKDLSQYANDFGGKIEHIQNNGNTSRMIIRIPDDAFVVDGIIVEIEKSKFIIPSGYISKIQKIDKNQIIKSGGIMKALRIKDEVIEILLLENIFGNILLKDVSLSVILDYEGKKRALMVDNVLEKKEFAVKPLGEGFENLEFASKVSIVENGKIAPVLDIGNIM